MLSVASHVLYLHDKSIHLYSYEGCVVTSALVELSFSI